MGRWRVAIAAVVGASIVSAGVADAGRGAVAGPDADAAVSPSGDASSESAAPSVAQATVLLQQRSAERAAAAVTARQVEADRDAAEARVDELSARDRELSEKIRQARRIVRDYAVAAYIDGGQSALYQATLDPDRLQALAWRTAIAEQQAMAASDAAAVIEQNRAELGADLSAAAVELDELDRAVTASANDLIQASAHERDAEAALSDAVAAEAVRKAEQERRSAQEARLAAEARAQAEAQGLGQGSGQGGGAEPGSGDGAGSKRGSPTEREQATLARIRHCESRGNYSIVSRSGRYRGAYQFDHTTWRGVGGSGDPAAASVEEQDYRALLLLRMRGTRPWPVCGRGA